MTVGKKSPHGRGSQTGRGDSLRCLAHMGVCDTHENLVLSCCSATWCTRSPCGAQVPESLYVVPACDTGRGLLTPHCWVAQRTSHRKLPAHHMVCSIAKRPSTEAEGRSSSPRARSAPDTSASRARLRVKDVHRHGKTADLSPSSNSERRNGPARRKTSAHVHLCLAHTHVSSGPW